MFERASKSKLRFDTPNSQMLNVEDVWDLPLTGGRLSLDQLAIALNKQIKEQSTDSFVQSTTSVDSTLQLRFDIVKHIIDVKLEREKTNKTNAENKRKRELILSKIAEKQEDELSSASLEELNDILSNIPE